LHFEGKMIKHSRNVVEFESIFMSILGGDILSGNSVSSRKKTHQDGSYINRSNKESSTAAIRGICSREPNAPVEALGRL